jgi:hypothetical protein
LRCPRMPFTAWKCASPRLKRYLELHGVFKASSKRKRERGKAEKSAPAESAAPRAKRTRSAPVEAKQQAAVEPAVTVTVTVTGAAKVSGKVRVDSFLPRLSRNLKLYPVYLSRLWVSLS